MGLRVIINGVATSGIPVGLQVMDPPTTAPYVLPHDDDNFGPKPALVGTGISSNPDGTYSATSGANGYIAAHLELDPTSVVGDNYKVKATATLPDMTTVDGQSGIATAWKRVFLEKRFMFRHGTTIATDAAVGATSVVVRTRTIGGGQTFAKNDYIMLTHAPGFGQPKTPGSYYSGIYQISTRPTGFNAVTPAAGTGTVAITANSINVVGSGTKFTHALVALDVINVGTSPIETRIVTAIADDTHLTVDRPFASTGTLSYTVGDQNLVAGTSYSRLTLSRPLSERYERELLAPAGIVDLNDSVAKVSSSSGPAPSDYFDAGDDLITGPTNPFADAFTEYIVLPTPAWMSFAATLIPRRVFNAAGTDSLDQRFLNKWFINSIPTAVIQPPLQLADYHYVNSDNHQLLTTADFDGLSIPLAGQLGFISFVLSHERVAVVERGVIEQRVTFCGNDVFGLVPNDIVAKTVAHEVAHLWEPNASYNAMQHCTARVAYNNVATNPPTYCMLCDPNSVLANNMIQSCAPNAAPINPVMYQYGNGLAVFHYHDDPIDSTKTDSEYLDIRRRSDPWQP
jgi:hypothetical protein